MTRRVIVIGGGIGGLTAAIAYARRGCAVTLLERAETIAEVGAGLQISPNGMAVLRALGLADALAAQAPRGGAVRLRDGLTGRVVLTLDLAAHAGDLEYRFVHRADLIALLLDAARAAGVTVRTGAPVARVAPGPDPAVVLAAGERLSADLIVGADGVHSVARPALNGPETPFFTGQVAWRAVVPNAAAQPAEAWVHMAPGRHIVTYPLRNSAHLNLVAVEERADWVAEGWQHAGDPDDLRARFADFGASAAIALKNTAQVGVWGLFRHPVAARWWQGGVALLGDAAHPTLPFLAQGANMAMEDAWVLAAQTAEAPDFDAALGRYQALRRDRVVRVIEAANGNAWKYHLRNPVVRRVAHLGLSVLGGIAPARMLAGFDWLYRHDVTQEAP